MRLAVSVQTGGWYDETNPEESMKYIKECGFEGVDYNIDSLFKTTFDPDNLTSFFDKDMEQLYEYFTPLKKVSEKYEIAIAQAHSLFPIYYHGQEDKNRYVVEITKKMIAVCGYLECDALVIHPWSNPELRKEEIRQINLDIYRKLIPAAKQYGVKLCLENLYTMYMSSYHEGTCTDAEEACWYIDTLNAEAGENIFGFCLDVGHANMMSKNIYQYITTLGKRLTVLHINDNGGTCDGHMIPYTQRAMKGHGSVVDWDGFIKGLKEIGYEGPLSFETFRVLDQMPDEVQDKVLQLIAGIGTYFKRQIAMKGEPT